MKPVFKFGPTSIAKLETCEHDLRRVAHRALSISPSDFGISCGIRSHAEQVELVEAGLSQTMDSRHMPNERGLSEALDFVVFVGGKATWDPKYYRPVVQAFFTAAIEEGVQIESGILWKTFIDGPHIQLKRIVTIQ